MTDKAKIENEKIAAKTKNNYDLKKIDYELLSVLADKNTTNFSYSQLKEEVKTIVSNNATSLNSRGKKINIENVTKALIAKVCIIITRFNPYIKNVINDPELNNTLYVNKFYITNKRFINTIGPVEWRKFIFTPEKIQSLKLVSNPVLTNKIIDIYIANILNFTSNEIKSDLSLLKRICYPNIAKSEEWKNILVKIELQLKAIQ
jgi:hypothetical protein